MAETDTDAEATAGARRITVRHLLTLFGWGVALALFFHFFKAFQLLFLGVLAAGCVAAALYPLLKYVPASRAVSAIVVGIGPVLLTVGLVTLLSWLLASPIKKEIERWPEVREKVNATLADWSSRIGIEDAPTTEMLARQAGGMIGGGGAEVFSTTTGILSNVAIALVFLFFGSIYLLADRPGRLLQPLTDAMPARRVRQVNAAFADLAPQLRWWVIGTLFSMTVVGIAAWAGYAIVGLDFAVPLALLTGIAEIIPTVGPAGAFIVALLFAATQGTDALIGVTIVYMVIQLLESYVLIPLVMKKAVKVPPIVTLFTVVLWGKVFGVAGLFLAIPINLVIWNFFDHLVRQPRLNDTGTT